jgi:hypothetical protein
MTSAAKFLGGQRLELQHPSSNRFIGDVQPALGEQILDIAEAQGEAKVQPHRVSDDVGGESVASECDRYHHRPPIRNAPKFPVSVPSGRLVMPPNITLIPLPAKCPELNPQENGWQFLRDNWLSNRIFQILRLRTICSLSCSTATRIVIGRRCGSCGTGLRGFYHNRPRGPRCRATHDRTGHTAHGGSNWPTYDGSSYGTPRCSGQSTIVIGGSYCRDGKNGCTRKGKN